MRCGGSIRRERESRVKVVDSVLGQTAGSQMVDLSDVFADSARYIRLPGLGLR